MRILIADDEAIIRMGLKKMLRDLGHEVVTAVNGREALTMAERQQPDLAILDIKMPFTDGLQVAQTLARKQPMPVLILTAFSEQALIEKASDLSIHGYLLKPVKSEELAAAIAVATKRFAETQALEVENTRLEQKMKDRKIIDRAKGKLMQKGLTEEEAYRYIQNQARSNRMSLFEASEVILKWAE